MKAGRQAVVPIDLGESVINIYRGIEMDHVVLCID